MVNSLLVYLQLLYENCTQWMAAVLSYDMMQYCCLCEFPGARPMLHSLPPYEHNFTTIFFIKNKFQKQISFQNLKITRNFKLFHENHNYFMLSKKLLSKKSTQLENEEREKRWKKNWTIKIPENINHEIMWTLNVFVKNEKYK